MSDIQMATPVDDLDQSDEAQEGTFGSTIPNMFLPPDENYAEDSDTEQWVRSELLSIIEWTVNDRLTLEQAWDEIHAMVMMQHGESRRYYGRSDYYLPMYAKNRQAIISNLSRGMFPSDEYIDASLNDPAISDKEEKAKAAKLYMQWELDSNARFKTKVKDFLGNFVDTGTGVFKVLYKKAKKQEREVNFFGDQPKMTGCRYEGAQITARNIRDVYVFPTNISDFSEAMVVFEFVDVSRAYVEEMVAAGAWSEEGARKLFMGSFDANHQFSLANRLAYQGMQDPTSSYLRGKTAEQFTIIECYTFAELPKSAYTADETPGQLVPVRIVMSPFGDSLSIKRNPSYHQQPPYEFARQNTFPGMFYGYGHGAMHTALQLLTNDTANQANDCGIYAMNPIAIMNPNQLVGPPAPLAPGVAIYAHSVKDAVVFDRPPADIWQYGMQQLQTWIGMGQDFGGAPPILQGNNTGRAGKTATGAQILQNNARTPIQDLVEDIENQALLSMMHKVWKNAQQYRDANVMATVSGQQLKMSREDLSLNATFKWMASSQAVNNQVRAQQAIQLMSAIAPAVPLLMQMGYVVDFATLIQRIYVDGFGFRGFKDFIRPAQAVPGQPPFGQPGGAMPRPDQLGGVQAEQGQRARSALEQVNGMLGSQEPAAPGEGEDFMAIRGMADDMAGRMGG